VIHVSDPVAGIALIACGLGMFWSARAYVSTRRNVHKGFRDEWRRRHGDRRIPWWVYISWPLSWRTDLAIAYVLSAATVVGGILVLL
jgi:hypothetical protein